MMLTLSNRISGLLPTLTIWFGLMGTITEATVSHRDRGHVSKVKAGDCFETPRLQIMLKTRCSG